MLLKRGVNNELVKKVQAKLGVEQVGNFGPKTQSAVKNWQASNGLAADGIVGPGTWKKMFGTDMPGAAPAVVAEEAKVVIPPSEFKLENLKGHIPSEVIAQIPEAAEKFNITNTLRLAHFLAQCGHESGGFKFKKENLNYSSKALKAIFGRYFPGNLAEKYARNQPKIGARVYGGRMGNGEESTGEGYKFRGRGYIQLTGKNNYTQFAKFIGEDTVAKPDLVADKYPLASAAFFFDVNRLWKICDRGATDDVVTAVTRRVNGGTIGLKDRLKHFREYYNLLK